MYLRCSFEGTTCFDCPVRKECKIAEHSDEVDLYQVYTKALEDVDNIITEQLDKSDNQVECQTLRWVLDKISELV